METKHLAKFFFQFQFQIFQFLFPFS